MLRQDNGEYACIAEDERRYNLGEAKEELMSAMGLDTEVEGSAMQFLRRGYKVACCPWHYASNARHPSSLRSPNTSTLQFHSACERNICPRSTDIAFQGLVVPAHCVRVDVSLEGLGLHTLTLPSTDVLVQCRGRLGGRMPEK